MIKRREPERDKAGSVRGAIQEVTTRIPEEQALRESEEKFEKAFRCSPQPFTISSIAEDRYLDVNEAFELTTGYTRKEAIGRTTEELGIWESRAEREKLIERALRGEKLRNIECRFRKKNGEIFIGLLSAELIDQIAGVPSVIANVIDITDWRSAEEALRASERKAALCFQQTMFGVVEWDQNFRVVEWNSAAESIFGYSHAEAVGRHANELLLPADVRQEIDVLFEALIRQAGGGRLSINDNVTKSGERITCEWFNTPLVGRDGNVSGVISFVRNISAQVEVQAQLAASQATLSAVVESTEDLIWVVDPERFGLMMFNTAVSRYFSHERGFEPRVGMTPDELAATPSVAEFWKDCYRRVLREGSFKQEYKTFGQTTILDTSFYPLFRDAKILGISVFAKDVTQQRQTERALKRSEDRYRGLLESSHDWVWEVDADTKYTYVGPQCRKILGYKPEEILGKTPFELMPEKEAARVAELFAPIATARESFRGLENTNIAKDGRHVILETNGVPIFDERGNLVGYRGMDRDITGRKRAEVALRESEERFRRVVEHIGDALFVDDAAGHIVFANDQFLNLFGFSREELPNIKLEDYVAPGYRATLRDRHDRRIRDEAVPTHFEYEGHRSDGRRIWLEVDVVPVKDKDGRVIGTQSALRDITERKRAAEAVKRSEEKFSKAFMESPLALTLTSVKSHRYIDVNNSFERFTGWRRDEVIGKVPFEIGIVDPEQRKEFVAKTMAEGSVREFEFRYRCKNGSERWALAAGELINIEDESCILAVIADITERKQAEEALAGVSRRLIQAQEQERTRIARDLHDDIAQRLALLTNHVESMRKSTRSPELRHTITDVREKLIGVVTSVQKMSHELHSSKLEYFGLVPAIRSFCNEFSEGEKVAIHFNSEAYPVLCQLSFHFPCSESCKKLYGMPSSIAK